VVKSSAFILTLHRQGIPKSPQLYLQPLRATIPHRNIMSDMMGPMAHPEQVQMEKPLNTRTIISLGHIWVLARARKSPNLLPKLRRKARRTPSQALLLVEGTHGCQVLAPSFHPTPTLPLHRQLLHHHPLQKELKPPNSRIQTRSAQRLPLVLKILETQMTRQVHHHKLLQSPVILLSCKVRFGGCRLVVEQLQEKLR